MILNQMVSGGGGGGVVVINTYIGGMTRIVILNPLIAYTITNVSIVEE